MTAARARRKATKTKKHQHPSSRKAAHQPSTPATPSSEPRQAPHTREQPAARQEGRQSSNQPRAISAKRQSSPGQGACDEAHGRTAQLRSPLRTRSHPASSASRRRMRGMTRAAPQQTQIPGQHHDDSCIYPTTRQPRQVVGPCQLWGGEGPPSVLGPPRVARRRAQLLTRKRSAPRVAWRLQARWGTARWCGSGRCPTNRPPPASRRVESSLG